MRTLSTEEVQKLAGLENHFDRVLVNKNLLTEMTVRNYCGNSFHPDYIQAAAGQPDRLTSWLTAPTDSIPVPHWKGVIHPKQARTRFQALREQVQHMARRQQIRDIDKKQIGVDPMPDFPIHNLDGNLVPVMPTLFPVQLPTSPRKITAEQLGLKDDKPPAGLSETAVHVLQQQNMWALIKGMRFFGAGINRAEDIFPFFFGMKDKDIANRYCQEIQDWMVTQLQACPSNTEAMAHILLVMYQILKREKQSVHVVHVVDWNDYAFAIAFGDAPAQWTVYCVQFPKLQAFQIDTAAWHYHDRSIIPWQPSPHLWVFDGNDFPFCITNALCQWFALPSSPDGHYLVGSKQVGVFHYTRCVRCLLSWLSPHIACHEHTPTTKNCETIGIMFADEGGRIAVGMPQCWQPLDNSRYTLCLLTASIDPRLHQHAACSPQLWATEPFGSIAPDLNTYWALPRTKPLTAFSYVKLMRDHYKHA